MQDIRSSNSNLCWELCKISNISVASVFYESVAALNLAPLTPVIADFEEFVDLGDLAPVVPAEADFE